MPADAGRLRGVGDESAHHRNNLFVVYALLKREKRDWTDSGMITTQDSTCKYGLFDM